MYSGWWSMPTYPLSYVDPRVADTREGYIYIYTSVNPFTSMNGAKQNRVKGCRAQGHRRQLLRAALLCGMSERSEAPKQHLCGSSER